MLIDLKDDKVVITQTDLLKPYQKSQLGYWGFTKEGDRYISNCNEIGLILFKLINYLEKEKIAYRTSDQCQAQIDKFNINRERIGEIIEVARNFKNGNYQDSDLLELNKFLQTKVPRKLKNHQIKAVQHLYLVQNGANFSVPGSGKTSVVLSVYEKLRLEGKVNTLFVVGPPACFQPWRDEFKITLGRAPKTKVLAGGSPDLRKSAYFSETSNSPELFLTTFQTLLQDQKEVITFMKRNGVEIFLVVDEAHYIKQINGSWATAVIGISAYSKFKCILTGTPMPKDYSDIYNLFDFLWSNNNPLDSSSRIKIQQLEARGDEKTIKETLDNTIGPLFYRVRKVDLGLKPPIFHKPIILQMNENEKKLYSAIESRATEYSKMDYLRNIEIVKKLRRGRMIRLRQCVSYTALLKTVLEDYKEDLIGNDSELIDIINNYDKLETPAKIEHLFKFVKEMQAKREKIIIWSNFIETINLITKLLLKNNINCKKIYGATPIEQTSISEEETREKIRQEFIDPDSGLDVLVANPAACAESISLHTTCHSAIYYDLSHNCAQYLQSLDRIHRVGGSESVDTHYYFLQYENTVDQEIIKNLNDKAAKMNSIIEENYAIYNLDMSEENDDEAILESYLAKKGK
jgi:SNF2 family DNA or RNA helicase